MDKEGPSLEEAQAAMRANGIRATLKEEKNWCWHVVGCNGRPRVIDYDSGAKLYLSRWLLDHFEYVSLTARERWRAWCKDATCVNPEHWEPKSEHEPAKVSIPLYGARRARPYGIRKLSHLDYAAIRVRYRDGERQADLADDFGVDRTTINKIVKNRDGYGPAA